MLGRELCPEPNWSAEAAAITAGASMLPLDEVSFWRRDLKALIGDDPAFQRVVAEALLWFGSMREDRAVLFAVLELHDNGWETALAPFREHPNRLVRRRVAATINMARGEPDAMELLRAKYSTAAHNRLHADVARTREQRRSVSVRHWRAVVGLAVVTTAKLPPLADNQPRRPAQLRGRAYLPARSHPAQVATADPQSDHQTAKALGLTVAAIAAGAGRQVIE
jgi:hypothetical protein